MRKFVVFLLVALAAIIAPAAASAKTGTLTGLYNQRYCEIFAVSQPNPPMFSIDVYNTVGLNDCPPAKWNAVDYAAVKEETGSIVAVPNGPRRWLLDTIANGEAGAPVTIGGLPMRHVAVLEVPSLSPPPYSELHIARTTTWVFNKGRRFHFLISPAGGRYALQAYTTNVDKSLRARNIGRIASNPQMALPDGWTFKTVKLRKQLRLRSPGMTTILRDGLGGTYQKFTWPKYYAQPVKKHRKPKRKRPAGHRHVTRR